MPNASQRRPDDTADARQAKGGARTATNETPVSSKENPAPAARKDGNTPTTRPAPQASRSAQTAKTAKHADLSPRDDNGEDVTFANGRDHPAECEHDHKRNKLNGESAKRTDVNPEGWTPVKEQ